MMSDGTIKIIDRKKDLVKLQGGEYVSLGKVESLMKLHKGVENVCIYADPTRMHTVAMVIPTAVWLEEVQAKLGKAGLCRDDACRDPEIVEELTSALWKHGLNQRLEKFEVPKALFLVSEPWTPESGWKRIQQGHKVIQIFLRVNHVCFQAEKESFGKCVSGTFEIVPFCTS